MGVISKITTASRCLVFLKLDMLSNSQVACDREGRGMQQASCLVAKQAV